VISGEDLVGVDEHWAVQATGPDAAEALMLSRQLHAAQALADVMDVPHEASPGDLERVDRVSLAYEMAAVENLDPLLSAFITANGDRDAGLARAGAHRAFELRRCLPVPEDEGERVFHILHLLALAYAGERWTDAQRWLREQPLSSVLATGGAAGWDQRVVGTLFGGWLALLRKEGWDDLRAVQESVMALREQQQEYEPPLLEEGEPVVRRAAALRLVALYNWARATEALGMWLTMGPAADLPGEVATVLDQHMEAATAAAGASGDLRLETLLRWLHVAARQIAAGALWSAPNAAEPQVAQFIEHLGRSQAIFELLPPQLAVLSQGGLLDQAARAVVVDLPTSGGKTALAQFRILQALQFAGEGQAWVAYVAPTRALVAQITRRLRRDFSTLGVRVEALSAAVEIDALEAQILGSDAQQRAFDVLVCTPEKLDMVVRNSRASRPMALAVIDEGHNIEDPERGLSLELLLATLKRDSPDTRFLLLMPYVPNADDLARWLSAPSPGRSISLSAGAWQPNERVVGMYSVERAPGRGNWQLQFESLITTQDSVDLQGTYPVGGVRPLAPSWSDMNQTLAAGAMATVVSGRGTAVAVGRRIVDVWNMARTVREALPQVEPDEDVALIQRYLATEVDPDFELIAMLQHRVGVHHSGLSDETRTLMEYLAEEGKLRVLCATTSIAQGIDFPISSVFLASLAFPNRPMTAREFWNLAGRAGRVGQDSVGIVGMAGGQDPQATRRFVAGATGDLASRLQAMLRELQRQGQLHDLRRLVYRDEWRAFRSYVAHLWAQKRNLEAVIAETDALLRSTFGYGTMRASEDLGTREQAQALRTATFQYVQDLSRHPENATLADATGFSPEGVQRAFEQLRELPEPLEPGDWQPNSLFGAGSHLSDLVGVMLRINELKQLEQIASSGLTRSQIARIAQSWVDGAGIAEIAREYFAAGDSPQERTQALTDACRGIYRVLTQAGAWGLSALSKLPGSGLPWEELSEEDRRRINLLPAMLYHGVSTEAGVLMRTNAVPRSVAERLGERYIRDTGTDPLSAQAPREARDFLAELSPDGWAQVAPSGARMNGHDYFALWRRLSGVSTAAA
jgi:replicative superfamily II helicase